MFGRPRRLAMLAEGCFNPTDAKTAVGVLRYRAPEVAAVIDSTRAGRTTGACAGVGGGLPVVGSVEAAAAHGADSLLIGMAPQGGELPAAWRALVRDALARGWDVFSGLHAFLADDPEFAALSARTGAVIHDVRRPPAERRVAAGRAAGVDATVVLTVGSDCNVGKMTVALELVRGLEAQAVRAAFVATGQTGIFIADHGVAVDAVPADFVAGLVEHAVVEAARDTEFVVVEGQGALGHPGYSGVTLGLLHGAAPAALVLCHQVTRDAMRVGEGLRERWPIPPLPALRRQYETAAAWVRPAPVVALALNTLGVDEAAARAACAEAARDTGLPCTDPVRFGPGPIAEAVLTLRSSRASHA